MLEDAINNIQDLFECFPNLHSINVFGVNFEVNVSIDELHIQGELFEDSVKALEWLEEKHKT